MMNGKYLITTDNWFYAPNGKKYKAAWGEIEILEDNVLGVKTNRNSTNWYAKIGSKSKHIVVSGCQVNYAVSCKKKPITTFVVETQYNAQGTNKVKRECEIYIAE